MAAPATVTGQPDSGEHRMRPVGYLHGSRGTRMVRRAPLSPGEVPDAHVCESPLLWACESGCCRSARPCSNHRESKCRPCATRYRRRFSRLIEEGVRTRVYRRQGFVYLLTLNAPGDEGHNRWVPGKKGRHGLCSCWLARQDGDDLWNGSASQRWNRVRTRLKQVYPEIEYVRAVEVQRRGLLHHHVVVWSPVEVDPTEVQGISLKAGYGCVFDLAPLDNAEKASRYLAKYVSKAVDQRSDVPWLSHKVDTETGEMIPVRTPTYRAGQASRGWDVKMADLRAAARHAAAVAARRRRELEASEPSTDDAPQVGNVADPSG